MKLICCKCSELIKEYGTNNLVSHGICIKCAVKSFMKRDIWKFNYEILKLWNRG